MTWRMTWLTALTTGLGAGLAYFGGLWLTVRFVVGTPRQRWLLAVSLLGRLALVGVTLFALAGCGAGHAIAGLAGVLLARRWLLNRSTREGNHAR